MRTAGISYCVRGRSAGNPPGASGNGSDQQNYVVEYVAPHAPLDVFRDMAAYYWRR